MCCYLKPEIILANWLYRNADESVNIKQLMAIRDKIVQEIPGVYIDTSRASLIHAVLTNYFMFEWQDGEISRADESDDCYDLEYIDESFNWRIPDEFKEDLLAMI